MNVAAFSIPFFEEMTKRQIPYAVCGNYEGLPHFTEHDIDLWSPMPETIKAILFEVAQSTGYRLFMLSPTANGFNSVFYGQGRKNPWVKVDVMNELSLLSTIPLVKSELIAQHLGEHQGIRVIRHELGVVMNFCYAFLSRGCIKRKYRQAVQELLLRGQDELLRDQLSSLLGNRNTTQIMDWMRNGEWKAVESASSRLRKKLVIDFLLRPFNGAFLRLIRLGRNHLHRALHKSGYYIAFVGIDGAGKTTLLEALRKDFEFILKSDKVHQGYWRPFLLPELKALNPFAKKNTTPTQLAIAGVRNEGFPGDRVLMQRRSQKVRNPGKILYYHAKFLYYWLDFLVGPLCKFWSHWSRGGVALFDRAYIDMELMPERFDFRVSQRLMRVMRTFIPEPDATFFLWAPPEVIHTRKIEFEQTDIQRQIDEYMAYRNWCRQFIDVNTSAPLEAIKERVILALCEIRNGKIRA
jgi:thymidylate kinase